MKALEHHIDRVKRNMAMDANKTLVNATGAKYFDVTEKAKRLENMSEMERKEIDPDDAVRQLAVSAKAIIAERGVENTLKAKASAATPAPNPKTEGSAKSSPAQTSPTQSGTAKSSPAAPAGGAGKTGKKREKSTSGGKGPLLDQKLSEGSGK